MIRSLLVPNDFSTCADLAFTHAAHLAEAFGATLHELHVRPEAAAAPDPAPRVYAERRRYAKAWAHRAPLVYVETEAAAPAEAIVTYARRRRIDLVVLGAFGRGRAEQPGLGRTAEAVVRRAPCSVLTVRPRSVPFTGPAIRRILVPFDFSAAARAALDQAAALARVYKAHVAVLHVLDPAGGTAAPGADRMATAQARSRAATVALSAEVQAQGLRADLHIAAGEPADAVVAFAERDGTDLLVVAAHGASGKAAAALGHTAWRIVRTASCPVLTTRRAPRVHLAPRTSGEAGATA